MGCDNQVICVYCCITVEYKFYEILNTIKNVRYFALFTKYRTFLYHQNMLINVTNQSVIEV